MSLRVTRDIAIRSMARAGMTQQQIADYTHLSEKTVEGIAMGAKGTYLGQPRKYSNKPTNGFSSKREAKRAQELQLLERAEKIRNLKMQVWFELIPAQAGKERKERAAHYVADFVYDENGLRVVEDCKGYRTAEYRLKRKLMLEKWGIEVRET